MPRSITFIVGISLLFALFACKNKEYFLVHENKIWADNVTQIDFYSCNEHVRWQDSDPVYSVKSSSEIHSIIHSINYSNSPTQGKGACWDKICILKLDSTIVLNTNGEMVGRNGIGDFYYFQDPELIEKYLTENQ